MLYHTIPPVFDARSKILILGSFPSPRSRETGFYYGHPQNRFWPLLGLLFDEEPPSSNADKCSFLKKHRIALWDVVASCEIQGAEDNSISVPSGNDIRWILSASNIKTIFTNGKVATDLYQKLCFPQSLLPSVYLPSTSPANRGRYPLERLKSEWKIILTYL